MLKNSWFHAGLAALLVACGTSPETRPTPSVGGTLYQLDVRLGGDETAHANLTPLGTPGLSAQQLTSAPNAVRLVTPSLTTLTFITKKAGVDVRHISTTFQVTNTTAAPLTHLVLVPVILTDTDGDSTNNATAPTIAGTPYRSVQLFDGSDASAQAASLTLTHSQQVDITTGISLPNPAATPFLPDLETSGLSLTPPAGLTLTPARQGWLAAETLAPGATVPMTFAVDIPIQRSAPKTQVFGFSLLFTTAQDITGTDVGWPASPGTVQGVLPNWTYSGTFNVAEEYLSPLAGDYVSKQTVPLPASGVVRLDLIGPSAEELDLMPLLDDSCVFTGERSLPNVNAATPQLSVYSAQNDPMGLVKERDLTGQVISRLYAEQALSIHGTNVCADIQTNFVYDLNLEQGWNLVRIVNVGEQNGNYTFRYEAVPSGTRTRLSYAQRGPWVSVQQPAWGSDLNLRAGQSLSVPFILLQGGGIAGPVTIETDVPGISVTPSALTLPSLNSQGLEAQAVHTPLTLTADAGLAAYIDPLTLTFRQNGQVVGRVVYLLTVTP